MTLPFILYVLSARDTASGTALAPQDYADQYRTRLDIIWSCLTTVFLCTWVSLHSEIPEPADTTNLGWRKALGLKVKRFLKWRLLPFITAVFAPEANLSNNTRQLFVARSFAKKHGLSLKQAFFVMMGGFYRYERKDISSNKKGTSSSIREKGIPLAEQSSAPVGTAPQILDEDEGTPCHVLDHLQVSYLLTKKMLRVPRTDVLEDRSKNDWLAKSIVVVQTLWFIAQCMGRKAQHLPLTELEVVTLAYAVANIANYIVCWEKPYQIGLPERVYCTLPDQSVQQKADQELLEEYPAFSAYLQNWTDRRGARDLKGGSSREEETLLFYSEGKLTASAFSSLIYALVGSLFGAVHFFAWSAAFPTHKTQVLWHVSSIVITVIPVTWLALYIIGPAILSSPPIIMLLYLMISFAAKASYAVCRFIPLVLAFMTLKNLSLDAYRNVEWADLLPHV